MQQPSHEGSFHGSQHSSLSSQHSHEVDENRRLESFMKYPSPTNVNVLQLAKSGFFYNRPSPGSYAVVCVGCGKEVQEWNVGDEPNNPEFHEEHCRFVRENHENSSQNSLSESLVRASVQSNDEQTKPLETTPSMSTEHNVLNPSPYQEQLNQPQVHSLDLTKKNENPYSRPHRETESLPVTAHTVELTKIQQRQDRDSRTTNVSRIVRRAPTPYSSEHSSLVSQQYSSIASVRSAQPHPGSNLSQISHHEGSFYNQPSTSHQRQQPTRINRLENPDSLQDILNNLEMREAQNRLYTFERFWSDENEFRNVRLLVMCGFYCIGQGDAVECFCCHLIAANWSRNDNPRQRHYDMSPHCRFIRGEDAGDMPLAPEPRRIVTPPQPMQQSPSLPVQASRNTSPFQSISHNPISHPSIGHGPIAHPSLEGAASSQEMVTQPTHSMIERSNLMIEFPCLNPANPAMREERVRLATFDNSAFRQHTRLQATNQQLAEAGLYYLGDGDRTKCWNCDGGLKDFQPTDDPWTEHAKYFPECEFLLQQRGPAFVTAVSVQFPNIQRPLLPARSGNVLPNVVSSPHPLPPPPTPIEDPQQLLHQREQILEAGMALPHVQIAREMGFTEGQIRDVMMRKILRSNCCYQSDEALIEALINPNAEESEESSQAQASGENLIDISGQTITIRGGNFIGPSVINGRIYDPSQQQQPPHGDGNIFADVPRSTRRRRNHTSIIINGQPMEDFINDAFNHDFFNNPTQFMQTHATAPTTSTPRTYDQNVNGVQQRGVRQLHRMAQPPLPAYFNNTPSQSSAGTSGTTTNSTTPVEGATGGSLPGASNATPGSAEERLQEMERERRCKVCYTETADILFQPCGHICACRGCSQRLSACPVCRRRIARYIRTYHV